MAGCTIGILSSILRFTKEIMYDINMMKGADWVRKQALQLYEQIAIFYPF